MQLSHKRVALPCARAQLAETATLGGAILGALHRERKVIEGAVGRHEAVNAELDSSSSVMRRMMRRAAWRRAMYLGIVGLLLAAIILVWWLKANARSGSSTHGSSDG